MWSLRAKSTLKNRTLLCTNELLTDIPCGQRSKIVRETVHAYIRKDKQFSQETGKRIITCNLYEDDIKYIERQVEKGRFPSTSEFVRDAMRDWKYENLIPKPIENIRVPNDCAVVPEENNTYTVYNVIRRLE